MTNGPQLRLGQALAPGLLAVALFGVMALIVLNTSFGSMTGFPEGIAITSAIGYAMFDFAALQTSDGVPGTEPFLVSFILIAIALDAALDASLVLAKREEAGEPVAALSSSDQGRGTGTGTPGGATTGVEPDDQPVTDGGNTAESAGGADR